MAEIHPLRRRVIDDMMIRNPSPATQQSCLYAVAKFSRHFERAPDRIGLEEVRAYQLHLIAVPGFGAVKILFGAARDAKMPERCAVGQLKRFVSNVEIERHVYD